MSDDKYLGMLLRRARRSANMTQADCARGLGVTVAQLRRYEMGKTKIPYRIMISIFRWGLSVVVGVEIFTKYYVEKTVV